jgi:predicted nucleic acid-binding protein
VKAFVLDANVAAKWFLPSAEEPFAKQAHDLLSAYDQGQVSFSAPDIFWPELGNVLWKATRRGRITEDHAETAVLQARSLSIRLFASVQLLSDALSIALRYQRAVYDSLYLAAAMRAGKELITADEKLANALGSRFPIRWIGSWAPFI